MIYWNQIGQNVGILLSKIFKKLRKDNMNNIEKEIIQNINLFKRIEQIITEIDIPDDNQKAMLFAAFLQDAMSHFSSMDILIEKRLYNSAFALVRIFFDTIVRGQYMIYILDEEKINVMYSSTVDWDFPKTKDMCSIIEAYFGNTTLEDIRKKNYGMMCDYTHIGHTQIARHFNENTTSIEPCFDDSLILNTLQGNYILMKMFAENFIGFMKQEGLVDCEVNI